ncbi:ABC-three component system middle component 1 [Pueribacillus sp. YX66]|uniref:ABC-three component system middle component 1 n=1 Tax=Pueribacillus sp. YX66 TaxID=3229242 RepID=UPI00358D1629
MNKIIRQIFYDNGFSNIELETPLEGNLVDFWVNNSKYAVNYYLVLYVDNIKEDFLSNEVPTYFNSIKKLENGYDEKMDKNLSMIVCVNTTNSKTKNITDKIFEIEEDPYFFKKYVITYNMDSYKQLEKLLGGKEESSNSILNRTINDTNKFLAFKKNEENDTTVLYEICTKLMIKIPFLRLEKRLEKMEDLSAVINEELQQKELFTFKDTLLNLDENNEEILENILNLIGDGIE